MKRWIRSSLFVAALAMTAMATAAPADEADCQDCRPAPDRWMCSWVWNSCPLWYTPCANLPFPNPGTE